MTATFKKAASGCYRVVDNGNVLGEVYRRTRRDVVEWVAVPYGPDGSPSASIRIEATRRQAARWLTEGPQWEVRVPGLCRWSEHLERDEAERERGRCHLRGALVQRHSEWRGMEEGSCDRRF